MVPALKCISAVWTWWRMRSVLHSFLMTAFTKWEPPSDSRKIGTLYAEHHCWSPSIASYALGDGCQVSWQYPLNVSFTLSW